MHRKDCKAKVSDFSNTGRKRWRKSPFIGTLNKFSLVIEGDGSDEEPEAESSDDEDETNTEFITLLSAVKNSGIFFYLDNNFQAFSISSVSHLRVDVLTISRGNSVIVLSCACEPSQQISECRPRRLFLTSLLNEKSSVN